MFKSYTMGAYTFTAKMPFRLIAVSALPFMDKDLYQGAYAENWRRNYDYVIFPMTLTLESKRTLLLSFGWQDRYAMLGRMDLKTVLDTPSSLWEVMIAQLKRKLDELYLSVP